MIKKIKYILFILLISLVTASNSYPIILVHGFIGWGRDEMSGYYLELHYHVPIKSGFLKQDFTRPVVTLFARTSEVDTDTANTTEYDRQQITLGLNYRPVDTVVYKFEYEINSDKVDMNKDEDKFVASIAVGF